MAHHDEALTVREGAGSAASEDASGAGPQGGVSPAREAPRAGTGCSVDGCGAKVLARGYCCRHYYQVKRHGHVTRSGVYVRPTSCREEGCDGRPYARGMCLRHYQQGWRARRGPSRSSGRAAPRASRPGRLAAGCLLPTCSDRPFADGFCRLHYIKYRHLELGASRVRVHDLAQTVGWMMPEGQTA